MPQRAGTLTLGNADLLLEIGYEQYRIPLEDAERLFRCRRAVPILKVHTAPEGEPVVTIEGHAAINRAGKAVLLFTRAGHYILPLVSFCTVANGEAASAVLLPFIPEVPL